MAQRVKNRKTDQLEGGTYNIEEDDNDVLPKERSSKTVFIFVGLLLFIGGALYVERSVLIPPPVNVIDNTPIVEPQPLVVAPIDHIVPAIEEIKHDIPKHNIIPEPLDSQPIQQPKPIEVVQHEVQYEDMSSSTNYEELENQVKAQIVIVNDMKRKEHLVMETNEEAIKATKTLQDLCRKLLPLKYGPEPYLLEMNLKFPSSMPDYETKGPDGKIEIEMAPIEFMPYSVLTFLDMVKRLFHLYSYIKKKHQVHIFMYIFLHILFSS